VELGRQLGIHPRMAQRRCDATMHELRLAAERWQASRGGAGIALRGWFWVRGGSERPVPGVSRPAEPAPPGPAAPPPGFAPHSPAHC
jgi:hypothetical protein